MTLVTLRNAIAMRTSGGLSSRMGRWQVVDVVLRVTNGDVSRRPNLAAVEANAPRVSFGIQLSFAQETSSPYNTASVQRHSTLPAEQLEVFNASVKQVSCLVVSKARHTSWDAHTAHAGSVKSEEDSARTGTTTTEARTAHIANIILPKDGIPSQRNDSRPAHNCLPPFAGNTTSKSGPIYVIYRP